MKYTYSLMEEYIQRMYNSIGIYWPHQLDMETIASRLGTMLIYLPYRSMTMKNAILIDDRLNDCQKWQEFGHELCHVEWHEGNQRVLPPAYLEYQEWKADSFAKHACIPTFMLERMKLTGDESKDIWMIQEKFHVEREFAHKRLQHYLSNLRQYY